MTEERRAEIAERLDAALKFNSGEISDMMLDMDAGDGQPGLQNCERLCVQARLALEVPWLLSELSRLTADNADVKAMHDDAERRVDRLQAALTAREGYVLVPVEPTEAMKVAADRSLHEADCGHTDCKSMADCIYRAMIAARPTPAGRSDAQEISAALVALAPDGTCKKCLRFECVCPTPASGEGK
jgi:hypothetical protein